MSLVNDWPVVTDDDGTGDNGTPFSASLSNGYKQAIATQVQSADNPDVTAAAIIDEVVTARTTYDSLDERIAGDIAAATTQAVDETTVASTIADNYIANGNYKLWSAGDTSAPDFWALSGSGATIARCGAGQGDTTQLKVGDWCAKLTYGSATAKLTQIIIPSGSFVRFGNFKARRVSFAVHMKSSAASIGHIYVNDGVADSTSGDYGSTNLSTDKWITGTHTMSASATALSLVLSVSGAGSVYFSGACFTPCILAPVEYIEERWVRGAASFVLPGTQTASNGKYYFSVDQPCIITWFQAMAETAPTGLALIFDLQQAVDATPTYGSMFTTTFPQIAISAKAGGLAPNGTFARRCMTPLQGATLAAGKKCRLDVTQIGNVVAGADVTVVVHILKPARPHEALLAYNDLGV